MWEKEKMLVTSIFSFSHNIFYPFINKDQYFSPIYFLTFNLDKSEILLFSKELTVYAFQEVAILVPLL